MNHQNCERTILKILLPLLESYGGTQQLEVHNSTIQMDSVRLAYMYASFVRPNWNGKKIHFYAGLLLGGKFVNLQNLLETSDLEYNCTSTGFLIEN